MASEALFHILGGKRAGWKAMRMDVTGDTHWFLKHKSGLILDPSRRQFAGAYPVYELARGSGFLTRRPSKRAKLMIKALTWQP